jgi:glycosyltransferase involved in cell wall biosynthesis
LNTRKDFLRVVTPPGPAGSDAPALVSVVVTVRNEAKHIAALLDSLLVQERPFEVLVIDSNSEDGTPDLVRAHAERHEEVVLLLHGGTRGESRNFGVAHARGEFVAFIDGDCVASPQWLHELRRQLGRTTIAAGSTQQVGWAPFERLDRVELEHKGHDVTFPSCNLAYPKAVFEAVGGFDPWFRTAEDIDLNYRAVDAGHRIGHVPEALVFHKTRSTVWKFLKQALWNGYGRKQLTLKHGRLWSNYSLRRMLATQLTFWAIVRLGAALVGYAMAYVHEAPMRKVFAEQRERGGAAPARSQERAKGSEASPARRP